MKDKQEYIFGIHPVREALRSRKRFVFQLFIEKKATRHRPVEEIVRLAKRNNVKIERVEPKMMDNLSKKKNHQGVIIRVEKISLLKFNPALQDLQAMSKKDKSNLLWLAIDEMTDPQNLGSIIRSAACLGFDAILLPQRRTVGLTPTVYKAASGMVEKIKIVEVNNLNSAILDLKKEGFYVYGADMQGEPTMNMKYSMPALLIIGSEGCGLRYKTREHCDGLVSIPQVEGTDSLNASSAASIIMYDIFSKTHHKK